MVHGVMIMLLISNERGPFQKRVQIPLDHYSRKHKTFQISTCLDYIFAEVRKNGSYLGFVGSFGSLRSIVSKKMKKLRIYSGKST